MDVIIIFGAKYLFIFVVLIFLYAWIKAGRYKKQMAAALVLAGFASIIMSKAGAELFYNPRPFFIQNITPLVEHAADNGFPSEHTLYSFTIATTLVFYRPKLAYIALFLAFLVGTARVAAYVHFPIDIIGGALMGLTVGWLGYFVAKYIFPVPSGTKRRGARSPSSR